MFTLFVHAVNTSGMHRKERLTHSHLAFCSQCGTVVSTGNRVAAHMTRYSSPVCHPYTGTLVLTTTCRACNSSQQATEASEKCCVRDARFLVCYPESGGSLGSVNTLWCWLHREAGAPPSTV